MKDRLFTRVDEMEATTNLAVATHVCGRRGPTDVAAARTLGPAASVETTWATQHRMLVLNCVIRAPHTDYSFLLVALLGTCSSSVLIDMGIIRQLTDPDLLVDRRELVQTRII